MLAYQNQADHESHETMPRNFHDVRLSPYSLVDECDSFLVLCVLVRKTDGFPLHAMNVNYPKFAVRKEGNLFRRKIYDGKEITNLYS